MSGVFFPLECERVCPFLACPTCIICTEKSKCRRLEQLRQYAVDYILTSRETKAAAHMWLPDWNLVARLESLDSAAAKEEQPRREPFQGVKKLLPLTSSFPPKLPIKPASISRNAIPHVRLPVFAGEKESRVHVPWQMCPHTRTRFTNSLFSHLSLPSILYQVINTFSFRLSPTHTYRMCLSAARGQFKAWASPFSPSPLPHVVRVKGLHPNWFITVILFMPRWEIRPLRTHTELMPRLRPNQQQLFPDFCVTIFGLGSTFPDFHLAPNHTRSPPIQPAFFTPSFPAEIWTSLERQWQGCLFHCTYKS